ncbi:hypothetical protein HSB1_37530 [Halogranum salarium B-1]|uniref:Uncharacterized protein n=1 Tax=Halogranum salarium B-1 TaxID=1210908 RepID=J3JEG1_9EURY|nr:hypothetical protein HSB1_37530 [Halogranum salarium B-1]
MILFSVFNSPDEGARVTDLCPLLSTSISIGEKLGTSKSTTSFAKRDE